MTKIQRDDMTKKTPTKNEGRLPKGEKEGRPQLRIQPYTQDPKDKKKKKPKKY